YCSEYQCKCYDGYGNCDDKWNNGCEIDLRRDVNNCGVCGNICKVEKGITTCENKICKIKSCELNYGDCNAEYSDGCEEELTSVSHCGSCENDCTQKKWYKVSEYRCIPTVIDNYICDISMCELNYANCNRKSEDGCEVDIGGDVNNCGECEKVCDANTMNVVKPFCKNGSCDYDRCRVAWEDKNYSRTDGCETYNYFPKTYGKDGINEEGSTIIPVKGGDEGFFLVGNSGNHILAVRLDINGNISWAKKYGDSINKYSSTNAIIEVGAGGVISYFILGSINIANVNRRDLLALRISDKGEILSGLVFSTASGNSEATSLLKARDGDYVVLGNHIKNNDSDVLVIKLNNNEIVWANSYSYKDNVNPGNYVYEYAYSIFQTTDGYYLIGGSTSLNNYDFLMILLKEDGDVFDAANFGGSGGDYGKVIIPSNNGYMIGGFTNSSGSGNEDIAVIFYTKDLMGYWARTYGNSNTNILINMNSTDNGYIISAQTLSSSNFYEGLLMNISNEGSIIWQKSYGGKERDMFVNSLQMFDGGIISVGKSNSFNSDYDIWVVKTDKRGNVPGKCPSGFSSTLDFLAKLFPLSFNKYQLNKVNLSTLPPSIPSFSGTGEELNVKMQCEKP
ncbi:MAG: hypothetical protein N2746_00380, partial [Deltaproteobacteria bacterium]|nr:hypothetical protein [Deltaproteobacteria bacterium]